MVNQSVTRVLAENLVGLGFLQPVSYIKSIPTHEKTSAVGKSGPNATFKPNFSWVGLALGGGVSSVSEQFGKLQAP